MEIVMKCIIAGSRQDISFEQVVEAIVASGWADQITEVVSGCAGGVDTYGADWAKELSIPVKEFPAKWDVIKNTKDKVKIKTNKFGKQYNVLAGFNRNEKMANYADAAIIVHNGSPGSLDMLEKSKEKNLKVFEYDVRKLEGEDELEEVIEF